MKKTLLYILALALLLPLAGCSTQPRPPLRTGPSLHLYVDLPADGSYWVEATDRHVGRYAYLGEALRIEGVSRFVYQFHVVGRTRSGETRLAITPRFYTVDDWLVSPHGDRMRPPEVETLLETMEAVIRNHPFTITLGPQGDILDSKGLTELEDALAGIIGRHDIRFDPMEPPQREAWRRVFMTHIDERPIRRHLDQAFAFLPGGLVRLGDRWTEKPANQPWPFMPTTESIRLIDRQGDHYLLTTETEFTPPPESDWPTYTGSRSGSIQLDAKTRLGVAQQESIHWKRKRKRTPWEQFTLMEVEGATSIRITEGPVSRSPELFAIDRYPFLEQ